MLRFNSIYIDCEENNLHILKFVFIIVLSLFIHLKRDKFIWELQLHNN